jgi:8-oxo-dGTP pyrophosphatase MutT (NUDIX family)
MRLRPRAEVFCFNGNKVLAAIRQDYVVFPGGGIDKGETPVQAAQREGAEESARRVTDLRVAHEPTAQTWPAGYRMKGFDGGYTFWMTGKASYDEIPSLLHKDKEEFRWMPVSDVLQALEKFHDNGWTEDNDVRIRVLRAHQAMSVKTAGRLRTGWWAVT